MIDIKSILENISRVTEEEVLEKLRTQYLGVTGIIVREMKGLASVAADLRPQEGAKIKEYKEMIREAIEKQFKNLE